MSVEIQTMGEGGIFEIAAVVIDEVLEIQPFTDVEYEILSSARDILAAGSILEAATAATTSANTAASAANTAAATAASFVGTGPAGYYATLTALQAAYPTGDTGIYVELEYGHWYYWSGSAWIDGGLFQAPLAVVQTTGTSETDVMSQKAVTDEITQLAGEFSLNSLFNEIGYIIPDGSISGTEFSNTGFVRYFSGDIIVSGYASNTTRILFFYDKYLQPISGYDAGTGVRNNLIISESIVPTDTYFIKAGARNSDNNAKLLTVKKINDYYLTLDDYINNILLMQELDDTISTPTFDSFGQPMSVIHRDANNRIIRSDTFTFSDTDIVEVRTFKDKSKTFTTELSTLKTTIL